MEHDDTTADLEAKTARLRVEVDVGKRRRIELDRQATALKRKLARLQARERRLLATATPQQASRPSRRQRHQR